MRFLLSLFAILVALFLRSQAQTPPLALGSVGSIASTSCPGGVGFTGADTCFNATVTCPGNVDFPLTYSYQNPSGAVSGTVVYFAAGQGTTMAGELIGTLQSSLVGAGFQVVKFVWGSTWWNTGATANLLNAACRPATLGQYFYTSVRTSGVFNVIGNSAGSSAVAYWLGWYGGTSAIHFAQLLNGPVFADLSQGCQFPKASNVTVAPTYGSSWSATVYYQGGDPGSVSTATGITCLNGGGTTGSQNAAWKAQSVTATGWISSYSTIIAAWVCNNNLNNSEGQAWLFFPNLTMPYILTAVDGCLAAEDVPNGMTPQGLRGMTAILNNMLQHGGNHP